MFHYFPVMLYSPYVSDRGMFCITTVSRFMSGARVYEVVGLVDIFGWVCVQVK